MSITELSIKRPSLIIVIFTVLAFLGAISYSSLSYELMPKFDSPVLSVTTIYPGASPTEVESSVTKRIEDALSTLENLDQVNSTSMEGVSSIVVMLNTGADVNAALQDAQRKINAIRSMLPDDVLDPSLGKFALSDMPVLQLGVTANLAPDRLYATVKDEIVPKISKVEGTAQVTIIGGEEREIKININSEKLESFKLTPLQVSMAIDKSNLEFPTGKIENNDSRTQIRLIGKYASIDDIRNVVVGSDPATGSEIHLSDIASVVDGVKEVKTFSRIDGTNSIALVVQKQNDANAVGLSEDIRKELKEMETSYASSGLVFEIAADTSEFTLEAANHVMLDLGLAIIIVALCMLLFLHSFRNSLIVMIAIPASLISVFIMMFLMGFTLNLMTLLAISLVVGILVDDSIVVLENIYRHLEAGTERREASIKGRAEIGFTAIGITLVDVVVFLPITMVGGIVSDLLTQFSLVIVTSTLMSLFVSFTLTPLLASRMAKVEHISPKLMTGKLVALFERFINWLTNIYGNALQWALGHKRYVFGLTIGLLFGSFSLVGMGFIGGEFVSNGDNGQFIISLELPQDATLEQTNEATLTVEEFLFKRSDVASVFTSVGTTSSQLGGSNNLSNKSEINVKLVPKDERENSSEITAQLTKLQLEEILPGVKVTSAAASMIGGANNAPIQISVTGISPDSNLVAAEMVMNKLRSIKGTSEVKLSVETGNPEVSVAIDKAKMSDLGLTMDVVGLNMQTAFSGNTNTKYTDQGKDYDINIAYDQFDRNSVEDLKGLTFVNNQGQKVQLEQFASITETTGSSKLERKNRVPSVNVTSQLLGTATSVITTEINQFLETNELPAGTTVEFEGNVKNMGQAFGNLGFALLASILFVYLIMVALYDSFVYPFVVLFSIPVAMVGALLALALTMESLSIFSMLGMIMLIGLVAKNAILLVDFANQKKAEGMNTVEALLESGRTRLRPILMTTVAMVLGMLPIALAGGAGAEWKNGLAWVLIGGLTSSMLLTLVVVPAVYLIVDMIKGSMSNKNAKKYLRELKAKRTKESAPKAVASPQPALEI